MITLTIPNDDTIALRQFGKALIEIASEKDGHPVDVTVTPLVISTDVEERLRAATETLQQAAPHMMDELRFEGEELQGKRKELEVDTTVQQVESLAVPGATHIITEQKLVGDNISLGDGNFSQGYVATVEEIADPVDSTGTPWDERIHSTSKALNADGTWRLRRKPKDMDEAEWAAFVESVKGELHTQTPVMTDEEVEAFDDVEPPVTHQNPVYMYQESRNVYALGRSKEEIAEYETKGYVRHTQEQYDAWEGPTVADDGDDFHTDVDVVSEQTVAGIPPLPVPPPVVVAPPVTEWDFPRLMTFLTERHGKIDVATVNTLLAQDGMSSVQELNAHPDKIGPFVARVKAHLGE